MSLGVSFIRSLPPAYFALVMATGIISVAAKLQGFPRVASALLSLAWGIYILLFGLTLFRLLVFPKAFFADFSNHAVAPGFFTTAAATGVVGTATTLIWKLPQVGWILWWFCILLAFGLIYSVFTVLIVHQEKPPIDKGLNGGWLVAVVATQSVSVLGGVLAGVLPDHREVMLFFSISTWLFGGVLYIWIIALIFYRYLFFPVKAMDLGPPYWINMGAVAISTLAGCNLIKHADEIQFLLVLKPFLIGTTLLFWATATWWIPMLLTLGFWRHVLCRYPLSYQPVFWSAIFPLGMYSVCTFRLDEVIELPFLKIISLFFWWVALICWSITFIGMLRSFLPSKKNGA